MNEEFNDIDKPEMANGHVVTPEHVKPDYHIGVDGVVTYLGTIVHEEHSEARFMGGSSIGRLVGGVAYTAAVGTLSSDISVYIFDSERTPIPYITSAAIAYFIFRKW